MSRGRASTNQTFFAGEGVGGFWSRGVTAFFDVRVTHVNSKCNQGKETSIIFKEQGGGEKAEIPTEG